MTTEYTTSSSPGRCVCVYKSSNFLRTIKIPDETHLEGPAIKERRRGGWYQINMGTGSEWFPEQTMIVAA